MVVESEREEMAREELGGARKTSYVTEVPVRLL
jgi:hypothetical protein